MAGRRFSIELRSCSYLRQSALDPHRPHRSMYNRITHPLGRSMYHRMDAGISIFNPQRSVPNVVVHGNHRRVPARPNFEITRWRLLKHGKQKQGTKNASNTVAASRPRSSSCYSGNPGISFTCTQANTVPIIRRRTACCSDGGPREREPRRNRKRSSRTHSMRPPVAQTRVAPHDGCPSPPLPIIHTTARSWRWWWYSVPPLLLTALAATVGLWVTTGALRNNSNDNNSYYYYNNYYPAARATSSSANNQKSNFRRPSNHYPPRKESSAAPAATVFLTSDIQASLLLDSTSSLVLPHGAHPPTRLRWFAAAIAARQFPLCTRN